MDKAEQTMLEDLLINTGRTLEEWFGIVRKENFEKHVQIMKFFKEQHSFTYGFAH